MINDYGFAVLLGIIEGLTEFLPISSTAHLRIVQAILGQDLSDPFWKLFSVFIQLGAIISVVFYFYKKLIAFLKPGGQPLTQSPLAKIMAAFVVTAIPAFLMSKIIGKNLESLTVIASSLMIGGFAMLAIEKLYRAGDTRTLEAVTFKQAVMVGAVQILSAVFPGTSRSMSTIAGGQISGLSRECALQFSFFVAIPTMAAATCYDLLKTLKDGLSMTGHQITVLAIGFFVSFVVGYAVIAWFMNWVKTRGFTVFALYRIALGLFVFAKLI